MTSDTGFSTATYRYLDDYVWNAVVRWLYARHPRLGWRKIKRRFLTAGAPPGCGWPCSS
ncbi:group II intron maturase-specific domain-containing protein [Nocardia sp. NPDC050408]|uniref:group II intron maturase-specific domain-containing protein n=1 Tax=Nocardia sp. NPDC050408 TaxID=3364319 RepID=UPI0037ADD5BE